MKSEPPVNTNHAARLLTATLLLGIVIFLASIALFAYVGTQARYWADDYCYSAWVIRWGLFPAIADWYQTSGNRLSTLVVVAASELFGARAIQFIPLSVLALWVAAWYFFLRRLAGRAGWNLPWIWQAWLSLVIVYFTALLAPSRLQTLYWRMGTLHYTLPLPLLLLNLGMLAGAVGRPVKRDTIPLALAGAPLAFFAAGLSETFAALQAGLFALAVFGALLAYRDNPGKRSSAWLLAAPLAGTLAMMAVMFSAPANAWRQSAMPPPDHLLDIPLYAGRYALEFAFFAIRGRSLPYLVFWLLMAGAAVLYLPATTQRQGKRLLAGAVLTPVVTIALIMCSFAPSAFAGLLYPAERAQMPGAFLLLTGLGVSAALCAAAAREWLAEFRQGWLRSAVLICLLALSLYPLRAATAPMGDLADLSVRAERWDARHQQILDAVRAGQSVVQVQQTDVVQGLEDIGPDSAHWINTCAALYYGASTIIAEP